MYSVFSKPWADENLEKLHYIYRKLDAVCRLFPSILQNSKGKHQTKDQIKDWLKNSEN